MCEVIEGMSSEVSNEQENPKFERLNIAPLLAETIRGVYLNQSVSPLFKLQSAEMVEKKQQEIEKILEKKNAQNA